MACRPPAGAGGAAAAATPGAAAAYRAAAAYTAASTPRPAPPLSPVAHDHPTSCIQCRCRPSPRHQRSPHRPAAKADSGESPHRPAAKADSGESPVTVVGLEHRPQDDPANFFTVAADGTGNGPAPRLITREAKNKSFNPELFEGHLLLQVLTEHLEFAKLNQSGLSPLAASGDAPRNVEKRPVPRPSKRSARNTGRRQGGARPLRGSASRARATTATVLKTATGQRVALQRPSLFLVDEEASVTESTGSVNRELE